MANYYRNRADFEKLREMMIQDKGLIAVYNKRTWPEELQSIHVSSARIKEYRKLLRKLGIQGGIEGSSDQRSIRFTSSDRGMVTHNSGKGYIYTEEPVEVKDIVTDLDHFKEHEHHWGLRRIEGNWYLFYEGY